MTEFRQITLKNLMIDGVKYIGMQFYQDKIIQALIKELPGVRWSEKYRMVYIRNSKSNIKAMNQLLLGMIN